MWGMFTWPLLAMTQDSIRVTGIVIDGVTMASIAQVSVVSQEETVLTDQAGRFSVLMGEGDPRLRFQVDGYLVTTLLVENLELEVQLFRNTFTETVEVVGETSEPEQPSSNVIAPEDVFEVAGSIDNIFRALDTLPGVASTDDFGSRLAVRGGTPDQNLTLMDGIEIHNPYRLFGITSAFNPETVENFSLTAGGFGVAYGDRLSSLLIVDNRPGEKKFQGATALSITDGNFVLEGATPFANNGTWLFSARRTYYDIVLNRLTDQNLPAFVDFQLQAGWEFGPGHRFSLTGLRSVEDADFSKNWTGSGQRAAFQSDVKNDLASARFDAVLGSRSTSTTIVSWYRNRELLDFNGKIRADAKRSNSTNDGAAFGFATIVFDRVLSVQDLSVRQDLSIQATPKHLINTGFELHRLNTRVKFATSGDRNGIEANGSSIRGGVGLPDNLDSLLVGTRGGFWIQDTYKPSSRLSIEPGLRMDWSTINGRGTLSPRVALSYAPGGGTRMRLATGLYTQSPGYEKLIQSDYFIDLSDTRKLRLEYEKALHVVLGVEKDLGEKMAARVEGYYKKFDDLLIGRLETKAEQTARVSQYDFSTSLQNSIPTAPLITSNPTNEAGGHAYGFDVYLNHTNLAAPLTGWLSYAWTRANRESYGRRYAFEYDRRHAFNAVGRYRLTSFWYMAATARIASGFPYTAPVGLRVSAKQDSRGKFAPETDPDGNFRYTVDYGNVENLNSGQLPYYARVDFRTTFQPGGSTGRWSLYFEVINLLGRDNPVALEPQLVNDPDSTVPRLVEVASQGFPRIPTVGFRLRF